MKRFSEGVWIVVFAAVAAGCASLLHGDTLITTICVALLVALGLASLWRHDWNLLSPVILIAFAYAVIGVVSPIVYPSIANVAAVSARLTLPRSLNGPTTLIFLEASVALLVGEAAYTACRQGRSFTRSLKSRPFPLRVNDVPVLVLSALPVALLIAGTGWNSILEKAQYLDYSGSADLFHLASALSLPGTVLAAYVLVTTTRVPVRLGAIFVLSSYALIHFAAGTRELALLPLLIFIGWTFGRRPEKRVWPRLAVALLVTAILFPLPVTLRQLDDHGLIPYAEYLKDHPSLLYSPRVDRDAGNVLFSFPVTGYAAFEAPHVDHRVFWVSVDPRPGSSTAWYSLISQVQVNPFTPYSTLGELRNYGIWYLLLFFFLTGVLLSHLEDFVNNRLRTNWISIGRVAVAGLAGIFTLRTLQYPIRNSSRLLYYAIALEIGLWLITLRRPAMIADASSGSVSRDARQGSAMTHRSVRPNRAG